MSNSFTSPPVLVDPARVTAGLTIRSEEISRLGDMVNYSFAHVGCGNVISQAWHDDVFIFENTTMTDVCEWIVPRPSAEHVELKVRLMASCTVSGGGLAKITVSSPISGHSDSTTITITDTSRFQSVFNVITVAISSVEQEQYAEVTLSLDAPSGGQIEVAGVQANWSPLASPLATRALDQYNSEFIPMGANRLGADLPLTSRFGVDMLNDITMMRPRGRVLFSWSGVEESKLDSSSRAAAKGLGVFDTQLMYSDAVSFDGMPENDLDVDVWFYVENYDAADPLVVDVFGYRFTMAQAGWNSFGVPVRVQELPRSVEFRLPMYRTGLDETDNNQSNLLTNVDRRQSNNDPYVSGFMIVGV